MTIERRRHPRFETSLSCRVLMDDDEVLPATVANLSVSGLQMLCDRDIALRILPKGHAASIDPSLRVHVELPLSGAGADPGWVAMTARVLMVRRLAENHYCLHMEYTDAPDDV